MIRHAIQLNRINLGISISFSSKLIQRMISQWQLWFLEDLAARNNSCPRVFCSWIFWTVYGLLITSPQCACIITGIPIVSDLFIYSYESYLD
ncbi:hypothetical protein NC653_025928 [Populus alba x Populus x berolinensis]|uniref:Uncharacterized protein n=1 Tax=Populus alba x Populus x berolinensis TaxID=444605 RepID=A0AAD6QAJ0_9ROSI|nr:hypothetical protein NC653_025928 [Populus alba x Populus x berolinensis]